MANIQDSLLPVLYSTGEPAIARHALHMSRFISQIRPALRNVTTLCITTTQATLCAAISSFTGSRILAVWAVLLLIAYISPKLMWLVLILVWGPRLAEAFGVRSPYINHHDAVLNKGVTSLIDTTLSPVSTVLAYLIGLTGLGPKLPCRQLGPIEGMDVVSATCSILTACPRLIVFSQTCSMSAEVWAAMPCSVSVCLTGGVSLLASGSNFSIPPTWPQHVSLLELAFFTTSLSLRGFCVVLAAAPCLHSVKACAGILEISTTWTVGDIPEHLIADLILINKRLQAGLNVVNVLNIEGGKYPGLIRLTFVFHLGESQVFSFMTAAMPPLPCLVDLDFHCNDTRIDMLQLTRMCRGMQDLKLSDTALDREDLLTLGCCPELNFLRLENCRGVTCAGVAAMCASSNSLMGVFCLRCKDMNAADGRGMGRQGWGGKALVVVRAGGWGEMWYN